MTSQLIKKTVQAYVWVKNNTSIRIIVVADTGNVQEISSPPALLNIYLTPQYLPTPDRGEESLEIVWSS